MKRLKIISIPDTNIWYSPLLGEIILWDEVLTDCDERGFHPRIIFDSFTPQQLEKLGKDIYSHLVNGRDRENYGLSFFINSNNVIECTDDNILEIIISDLEREVK